VRVAPTGYGKTMLASAWLARSKPLRSAWLSLDGQDERLSRFMGYLCAALAFPEGASASVPPPPSSTGPQGACDSVEDAIDRVDALLSAIDAARDACLLVLDNCHVLSEQGPSHQVLSYLVSHMPDNLRLIVSSRSYPRLGLTKWLFEDRLVVLSQKELCLTRDEIVEAYSRQHVVLNDACAQDVWEHTKGWPAIVRLLALEAGRRKGAGAPNAPNAPDGGHADISNAVCEYLVEELLGQLDGTTGRFLAVTAQVEVFCASLAEAMTGSGHAAVLRTIARLCADGVIVEETQRAGNETWYSYVPFLATALRRQALWTDVLQVEHVLKRASAWYGGHGNLNQSVRCAVRIRDWGHVERLMTEHWRVMYREDNSYMFYQWAKLLPHEVLMANPLLCAILALPALLEDDMPLVSLCMERASEHFTEEAVEGYTEFIAVRAQVLQLLRRYDESLEAVDQAMRLIPPSDHFLRSSMLQTRVVASSVPDWLEHARVVQEILGKVSVYGDTIYTCNNYAFLGVSEAYLGNFTKALECTDKALALPKKATYPYRVTYMNMYLVRLMAAFHRGNIAEAELSQEQHHTITRRNFNVDLLSLSVAFRALFLFVRGQREDALEAMAESLQVSPHGLVIAPLPLDFLESVGERLVPFEGFLEKTRAAYGHSHEYRRLGFMAGFLAGDHGQAEELRSSIAGIEPERRLDTVLAHLLLSLFEEESGRRGEAEQALLHAMEAAAPEHLSQVFYNEHRRVAPILERLGHRRLQAGFPSDLAATMLRISKGERQMVSDAGKVRLTSRESDVLYLLVSGYAMEEIATRLCISRQTVRKHVANIYRKHGVHSRTQLLLQVRD
jgi:LuxR family maltose regulon positive regulatory protein